MWRTLMTKDAETWWVKGKKEKKKKRKGEWRRDCYRISQVRIFFKKKVKIQSRI